MKIKVLVTVLTVITLLFILSSCSKINPEGEIPTTENTTESTTESTTEISSVTLVIKTTEEESSKEKESETSLTEKIVSTVATTVAKTTAKVTTTTKKETTTKPKTTNAPTTTAAKNKYGVMISQYNGTTIVDRTWYTGTYDELLPAAKANRNNYYNYINEVLRLTNEMRAEKGLSPLKLSDKITEQANVRAEEIAWSGKHSHRRPDGSFFSSLFKANGYTTGLTGENIGWGYSTPSAVCQAWRDSQTHYENIMNPEFVRIGIGVAADPDPSGNLIWVQHFYSE